MLAYSVAVAVVSLVALFLAIGQRKKLIEKEKDIVRLEEEIFVNELIIRDLQETVRVLEERKENG